MGLNSYPLGSNVRLKSYDADDNGFWGASTTNADPTTVTLKVKDPAGTITTYASSDLTKAATGRWYYDLTMSTAGRWFYRYDGAGAVVAAEEGSLMIEATEFST